MKQKVMLGMVAFLSVVVFCIILNFTSEIIIPLVIAWFLLQISKPVMRAGERLRLPQIVNVLLVFVAIFAICAVCVRFFVVQVMDAQRIFNLYSDKISQLTNQVLTTLQIPAESISIVGLLKRYVGNISGGVLNFSSQFILTLIFLLFMLLETPGFDRKLKKAFPGAHGDKIKLILSSTSDQVSRYLGVMTIISLLTGLCVWIALLLIGVELAAGWGILSFLLNFIPTLGSIVATIPPVLMAMLQYSPTSAEWIITLVALGTIQMVTGNVLLPKMLGSHLGLSPLVVMLSLLVWGMILGIPGAILSVPIASIIKIVCENIPSLRPIAIVMSDEPPPPRQKAEKQPSRK